MSTTLDEWIKQEAEILAANKRGCGSGFCTPQQLEGKSGLEIVQGMMDGSLPVPYSAKHEGILVVEASKGKTVFQGKPEIQHLNPAGTVHGGWIANLMDSAMGSAILSYLPPNKTIYVTSQMEVDYARPIPRNVGRVRCLAEFNIRKSIQRDAKMPFIAADCVVRDFEGQNFAFGTAWYRISRGVFA